MSDFIKILGELIMDKKGEYLMLREEILHLDTVINNTINFFYVFIAAYMAFALTKDDTIFLLLSYMVIFPAYLIVLSKMQGMCKIASYLYVFHEKSDVSIFKWERRISEYRKNNKTGIFSYIISSHFPFLLVSISVATLFFGSTKWENISKPYEIIKVIICMIFSFLLLFMIYKNRKISATDYIDNWKDIN